jgi:hypothetical protein
MCPYRAGQIEVTAKKNKHFSADAGDRRAAGPGADNFTRLLVGHLTQFQRLEENRAMGTTTENVKPAPGKAKPERIPAMQRILDNPFLLLFLGVTMPTVFYILWGIMEIVTLPVAP